MNKLDGLQRFVFEHMPVRGEIVYLQQSYATILAQHDYPPIIQSLLAELLLVSVLLSATLKFKGELTIQFHGEDPIRLLVAKCDDQLNIRGLARFSPDLSEESYAQAFAQGKLAVTIQQDNVVKPYQSIIPIENRSIAESIELYFGQSEQIPTKIYLCHTPNQAAGMLLQLLPEQSSENRERFWEYVTIIGDTVKTEELLMLDSVTLLHRCYHPDDLRLFDLQPVNFQCRCTPERMDNAIRAVGKKEAEEMLEEKPIIEVTCEFCNRRYEYDRVDIAKIFHDH